MGTHDYRDPDRNAVLDFTPHKKHRRITADDHRAFLKRVQRRRRRKGCKYERTPARWRR